MGTNKEIWSLRKKITMTHAIMVAHLSSAGRRKYGDYADEQKEEPFQTSKESVRRWYLMGQSEFTATWVLEETFFQI